MTEDDHVGDDERNPIERLAEEFSERLRRGETTTVEEYARRHPEHAEAILVLFPTLLAMEAGREERLAAQRQLPSGTLAPEEQVGDFRLLRLIGHGGMGSVYEAQQDSLGRRVALKVLPATALSDERKLRRFRREARTAAGLVHAHIVPVFGVGEHEGLHFYAMQLIEGIALDQLLREAARAPEKRPALPAAAAPLLAELPERARAVARIGTQIADALQYAHERGTLHRDIKPANLLLDEEGCAWVTDFGIAQVLESEALTRSDEIVGTLHYMAPEQSRGHQDARSDVYSLGLTLYELVTRRPAWSVETPAQLIVHKQRQELPAPRRVDPGIPRDLDTVLVKATAHDPTHRYASAGELRDDLQRFLEGRAVRARRVVAIEHLWRWCRRNRAVAGLAAALLLAVLAAVLVGWIEFFATQRALVREKEARASERQRAREARAATELAVANLELALQAFEDIFDAIAGRDLVRPLEMEVESSEDVLLPAQPLLSSRDVELLRRLVGFYDRFAAANVANARLKRDTARALRRIGDIHCALAEPEKATQAFDRALGLCRELGGNAEPSETLALEMAAIHNGKGLAQALGGPPRGANQHHRKALEQLERHAGSGASAAILFELVRTLHLLGGKQVPQGRPAPGRRRGEPIKHLQRALETAGELHRSAPEHPEYRLLLARSHRHLALALRRSGPRNHEGGEHLEDAIRILEELVASRRATPAIQHELAYCCAEYAPRGGPSQRAPQTEQRVRSACEIMEQLVRNHPGIDEYRATHAHALTRLGRVLASLDMAEEAEIRYRQALAIREALSAQHPSLSRARREQIRTHLALVGFLNEQGRGDEARELRAKLPDELPGRRRRPGRPRRR